MSLEYVKSGDAVRASTINSIIETLGGPECPSPDLQFTNTARGAIVNLASKYGGPANQITQLFEVKNGLSAWDMQLGTGLEGLLDSVTRHKAGIETHPDDAFFIVGNGSSDLSVYAIDDGSIKATSAKGIAHTGWTDTKIRASWKAEVFSHLLVEIEDNGDGSYEDTGILHLAIADTDDSEAVSQALVDYLELENSLKIVDLRKVVGRPSRKDGSRTAYGKAIQYHSGPIDAYDSSGSIVVDSDLSTFELSSLQRMTLKVGTGEFDDDGNEISDDVEFYELFDFHDRDNVVQYPVLSDYNMICRWKDPESEQMMVKYLPLSSDMCDTEVEEIRQKSVEHRMEDGKQFILLHHFEDPTTLTVEMDKLTAYDFLIRDYDGADGNELKYATLELSGLSSTVSSIVSCIIENNISDFSSVSNFISSVVNNNISNFYNLSTYISNFVENNISNFENLSTYINNNISNFNSVSNYISNIIENNISNFTNTTTYISTVVSCALSSLSGIGGISGDYNVLNSLKSIETKSEDKKRWHQIYKFDDEDYKDTHLQTVFHDCTNPIGCGNGFLFLVRSYTYDKDGNAHPLIRYLTLSVQQEHEHTDTQMSLDGDISPKMYSIEFDRGCGDYRDYLQLYEFNLNNVMHGFLPSMVQDDYDHHKCDSFVVRLNVGCADHEVRYLGFDVISSFTDYKGDSQLTDHDHLNPQMQSIQRNFDDKYGWYYGLYGWVGGSHNDDFITGHCDGCAYDWGDNTKVEDDENKYDQWYFLTQHLKPNGERTLEYRRLVVTLPLIPDDIPSGDDITNIWNNFDNYWTISEVQDYVLSAFGLLSGQLSDEYWPKGGDYTECYGYSIGDSNGNPVIALDERSLDGSWYVGYDLTCNHGLTCYYGDAVALNFLTWDASGCFKAGNSYLEGCCLYVDGCAMINSTLEVGDNATISGNLYADGCLAKIKNDLEVGNNATISGNIVVNGPGHFESSLHVDGCASVTALTSSYGITVGCGSAGLTIGQANLTESDLNKLLELVRGTNTATDKVNSL